MTTVNVLLFGPLRDTAGWAERPAVGVNVEEVWQALCRDCPALQPYRGHVRPAVDLAYAGWSDPVHDGATLAFLPPVGGGTAARVHVELTRDPIAVQALLARAHSDCDGAIDLFLGTVRNHADGATVTRLDYEAYEPMALALMRDQAARTADATGASTLMAVHRLGELAAGDVAIAVVAAAPHRAEAFAACRALVDAIKADVPIFKREHTTRATRWVNAPAPGDAPVRGTPAPPSSAPTAPSTEGR